MTKIVLRQIREMRGMTQVVIARKMGVSQPRISQIERAGVERLEISTIANYLEALDIRLCISMRFRDDNTLIEWWA